VVSFLKKIDLHKTNDSAGDITYSQGHFQLQIFYCLEVLNISRIIKSQTELQVLGLYTRQPGGSDGPKNILKILKELRADAQLFLPIFLILEQHSYSIKPYYISIFPGFYSVNLRASIPQILTQSFNGRDRDNDMVKIIEFSIFLIDFSDLPSVYSLAKDMAVSFPQIRRLNLWFECRCEIVSFLIDPILVTHLIRSTFYFIATTGD
jgi:hypothetical protein